MILNCSFYKYHENSLSLDNIHFNYYVLIPIKLIIWIALKSNYYANEFVEKNKLTIIILVKIMILDILKQL